MVGPLEIKKHATCEMRVLYQQGEYEAFELAAPLMAVYLLELQTLVAV